jgi:hypothetical protein
MAQSSDETDQRRDALLLRLLKTPPRSRAETSDAVRRAKGKKPKPIRTRTKRARATHELGGAK